MLQLTICRAKELHLTFSIEQVFVLYLFSVLLYKQNWLEKKEHVGNIKQ